MNVTTFNRLPIHPQIDDLVGDFTSLTLLGVDHAAADTFALSPAQVALSERLASGHDLASAAADLGVSVNTVRTQVRRMFEKTGTHSQTGLVSLLLSMQNPDHSVF